MLRKSKMSSPILVSAGPSNSFRAWYQRVCCVLLWQHIFHCNGQRVEGNRERRREEKRGCVSCAAQLSSNSPNTNNIIGILPCFVPFVHSHLALYPSKDKDLEDHEVLAWSPGLLHVHVADLSVIPAEIHSTSRSAWVDVLEVLLLVIAEDPSMVSKAAWDPVGVSHLSKPVALFIERLAEVKPPPVRSPFPVPLRD